MPKVVAEYREEAKKRIIEAAQQVFSEKGYHKATMQDIAQKLGVSKGALYLYFKSKSKLLNVIIEQWSNSIRDILLSSLEGNNIDESFENLFIHIVEDPITRMGFSFELISEASRNPSVRKILSEAYERNLKTVAEFLCRQRTTNVTKNAANIKWQSISLLMLQLGLMASLILGSDKTDTKIAWKQLTKTITRL
jgi:AcrR family transcriptional regulator